MRSANKCQNIPHTTMAKKTKNWSGIHMQTRITTNGRSPLAHACQVWSTSVSAFVGYPVYRITEWSHNLYVVGGGNKNPIQNNSSAFGLKYSNSCLLNLIINAVFPRPTTKFLDLSWPPQFPDFPGLWEPWCCAHVMSTKRVCFSLSLASV